MAMGRPAIARISESVVASLFEQAITEKVSDAYLQDPTQILFQAYPTIFDQLGPILAKHKIDYPITNAQLLMLIGQSGAAIDTLEAASPGTDLEEIVRLVLLLRAYLANPNSTGDQDVQIFRKWADSKLPDIRNSLSGVAKPLEKVMVYGQLRLVFFGGRGPRERKTARDFLSHG